MINSNVQKYEIFNDFTNQFDTFTKIESKEDTSFSPNFTPIKPNKKINQLGNTCSTINNSYTNMNRFHYSCEECSKTIDEGDLINYCSCMRFIHYSCFSVNLNNILYTNGKYICSICSSEVKVEYLLINSLYYNEYSSHQKVKNTNINNISDINEIILKLKDVTIYSEYENILSNHISSTKIVIKSKEDRVETEANPVFNYNKVSCNQNQNQLMTTNHYQNTKERKALSKVDFSHSPYYEKSTNNKTDSNYPQYIKSTVSPIRPIQQAFLFNSPSSYVKQKLNFHSPNFFKLNNEHNNYLMKALDDEIKNNLSSEKNENSFINQSIMNLSKSFIDNNFRKDISVLINKSNIFRTSEEEDKNLIYCPSANSIFNNRNELKYSNSNDELRLNLLQEKIINDFKDYKTQIESNISETSSIFAEERLDYQNKIRMSRPSIDKRDFLNFRRLQLEDDVSIYEQEEESSNFIPKESTRHIIDHNNHSNIVLLEIESGISNINLTSNNKNNIYEVPISIEVSLNKQNGNEILLSNYPKYYLIIFNSKKIDIDCFIQTLTLMKYKISENDRVWTNILNKDIVSKEWLDRFDLENIILGYKNNPKLIEDLLKNVNLTYVEYMNIVNYVYEFSLDLVECPQFEVIFISDTDNILKGDKYDKYYTQLLNLLNSLSNLNSGFIKSIKVNILALISLSEMESNKVSLSNYSSLEETLFLYDFTKAFNGIFYCCYSLKHLLSGFQNIIDISEQTVLLNCSLMLDGNKDVVSI